jgi:5-methylcytosine-specific restriction endonuclease McrA
VSTVGRGTTNGNARGNVEDRRRRREWLVQTYRADQDVIIVPALPVALGGFTPYPVPACRCYRCGTLLTAEDVTVDRIVPGCQGGTYRRNNIRPACAGCNSSTGGRTRGRL